MNSSHRVSCSLLLTACLALSLNRAPAATEAELPPAQEYLVRITLEPVRGIQELARKDVRVLADMDAHCLALADRYELDALVARYPIEVLDINPRNNLYFIVTSRRGQLPELLTGELRRFGTVLFTTSVSGEPVALLKTTEEHIIELNRLPVKLCQLSMTPMVLETTEPVLPAADNIPADSAVIRLLSRVSADSIEATIRRLQNFRTRYSTTDSCRAAVAYALDRMRAYGCDSVAADVWRAEYAPNAVGVRFGSVNPRLSYIICSHIDATSDHVPEWCPGADDNASGTAAVLEACRVLRDVDLGYSVQFIAFSGEEQGLRGSDSFATRAYRRRDTILGVINFDMISYGRPGRDSIVVVGKSVNPNCQPFFKAFCANADTYTTLRCRRTLITTGGYGSDHYSFWLRNYVAIWGEERDFTPCYHTIGDTIGTYGFENCGTNNIPLCTDATKAAVATIYKLAGGGAVAIESPPPARNTVVLSPNEPNPFAGQTVIRCATGSLPPGTAVRIFRQDGALVRTLRPRASADFVLWNGKDDTGRKLPAGIYFYRLEGMPNTVTGKAVLLSE